MLTSHGPISEQPQLLNQRRPSNRNNSHSYVLFAEILFAWLVINKRHNLVECMHGGLRFMDSWHVYKCTFLCYFRVYVLIYKIRRLLETKVCVCVWIYLNIDLYIYRDIYVCVHKMQYVNFSRCRFFVYWAISAMWINKHLFAAIISLICC